MLAPFVETALLQIKKRKQEFVRLADFSENLLEENESLKEKLAESERARSMLEAQLAEAQETIRSYEDATEPGGLGVPQTTDFSTSANG